MLNTRRADYTRVNPNMKIGRPRHALDDNDQARVSAVINKLKQASAATNDTQANVCLTDAYRSLRHLLSSRL